MFINLDKTYNSNKYNKIIETDIYKIAQLTDTFDHLNSKFII